MKRFDRYSIRGVICLVAATLGLGYQLLGPGETDSFLMIMYGILAGIGVLLLVGVKEAKE